MFNFYPYRIEVYSDAELLGTYWFVANVYFLALSLGFHPMYFRWTSIRVYDRQSGAFIGQYSREGDIPAKP